MATPPFTDEAAIRQVLTDLGVDLRTEDAPAGAVAFWVGKATQDVWFYLQGAGPVAQLAANEWVQDQTAIVAAYLLTFRGGDCPSEGLKELYEDVLAKLELIRLKEATVPGLVVPAKGGAPVLSNLTIDMQRIPAVRVVRPASTGFPSGYPQAVDYGADAVGRS